MELQELIKIVNDAYPDDKVQQAFERIVKEQDTCIIGDDLAVFIAREIAETFEAGIPAATQLTEAYRIIDVAMHQLWYVRDAIGREIKPS